MKTIKPCPFCGSKKIESGYCWANPTGYVLCKNCGVLMETEFIGFGKSTKEKEDYAIEKWNTRSPETSADDGADES